MLRAALATVAFFLAAAGAAAGPTPLVPAPVRQLVKQRAGGLAYAPTRSPFGYRYLGYTWNGAVQRLSIRLHDKHYVAANANHTATFTATWFTGTLASCGDAKEKTIYYDGNKVYWGNGLAWRCVSGRSGRVVQLAASAPRLPDVALALIVSSGKRLS